MKKDFDNIKKLVQIPYMDAGGQNTEEINSPFTLLEIKSQIYVYLSLDISGALGHGLEVPVG